MQCIAVSMGKREFHTWENGDFSFPLGTLREKLIITLYDAEGNQITETGVEAISIVEKRLWDDYFPLEGGGHVHMKLQFTLTEDERNRIRMMRQSASMKKRMELLNSSPQRVDTTSTVSNTAASYNREVSANTGEVAAQASVVSANTGEVAAQASVVSYRLSPQPSGNGIKEITHAAQEQWNTNDINTSEVASSIGPVPQEVEVHETEVTETPSVSIHWSPKEDSLRLERSDISEVTLSTASDSNEVAESMYPKQDSTLVEISVTSPVTSFTAQEPQGINGDSELYAQGPVEVISSQSFSVDESMYPKQDLTQVEISDTSEVTSSAAQELLGIKGDSEVYAQGPVEVISFQSFSGDESMYPKEDSTQLEISDTSEVTSSTAQEPLGIKGDSTLYAQGPVEVINSKSLSGEESPIEVSTAVKSSDTSEVIISLTPMPEGIEAHVTKLYSQGPVKMIKTQSPSADESGSLQDVSTHVGANKKLALSEQKEDHPKNPEKPAPFERSSSSVRKMISAFESNRPQDIRPDYKPASVKTPPRKVVVKAPLKDPPTKIVKTDIAKPTHESSVTNPYFRESLKKLSAEQVHSNVISSSLYDEAVVHDKVSEKEEEESPKLIGVPTVEEATVSGQLLDDEHMVRPELSISRSDSKDYMMECFRETHSDASDMSNYQTNSNEEEENPDLHRVQSTDKVATVSGQMLVEHIATQQPSISRSDTEDYMMECDRDIHSNDSHISNYQRDSNKEEETPDLHRVSTDKEVRVSGPMLVEHRARQQPSNLLSEEERCSAWIFPEEEREICVTTNCASETTAYRGRMSFSAPQHELENLQGEESSCTPKESEPDNSENVGNPIGPVGQAIKVAIMVGVGTLILFTRLRKNR